MAIALIVAGGQGLRMQMDVRKQYLNIDGRPVLFHTLSVFERSTAIDSIYLVVPQDDIDFCRQEIAAPLKSTKNICVVAGGEERQKSVYNGLAAMSADPDHIVVIHDGVRPFVQIEHIEACIHAAMGCGAAVLAVPVSDTIKQSDSAGHIEKTIDRRRLWAAQTPQAFRYGLIREAHDFAVKSNMTVTDDSALIEARCHPVKLVPGSRNNIKITTPDDLVFAQALLEAAVR